MNYYRRYVGDYMRDTADLSLAEHGAYTVLLDHYYATEQPLPGDFMAVCRICRAMTPEEQAAVRVVADRFFPVADDGMRHNVRADEEIGIAQGAIDKQRLAGALAAQKRWGSRQPDLLDGAGSTNGSADGSTHNPTDGSVDESQIQPPTTNHHPPTANRQPPTAKVAAVPLPEWLDRVAWDSWLEMRRKKKVPATPRAMELAIGRLSTLRAAGHDPVAVLDQSTLSGWTSLYEVKATALASRKSRQQAIEDGNRQVADQWANGGRGHA